ncbi:MAG TPA: aminotransferase class I/II-fold pyridoxal phosphate-dependent enzyme [Acidimicrobiia bacterium]|nr:aminotransferase class I/II-fold pyridoxal phosphate-dependent enzyme [Acidimicrobiia bacterium]
MTPTPAPTGYQPPPYPQDRVADLRTLAAATGHGVDLSIGDPCDPVPKVVADALTGALGRGANYPASVGFPEFREAASEWMNRRLAVSVELDAIAACVGTKEFVASLPRLLSLRAPERDTVLYPAIAYPTYAMGAELAGLRAVGVPFGADGHIDLSAVAPEDAERALLLWLNEPGNPTGSVADASWFSGAVAWARRHGVIVASDECYVEFTFDGEPPATALGAGSEGVLAVHSLSKRSNMAGLRAGFVAGDPDLVRYLGEMRKHLGLMVPGPVQIAAAAAWRDDEHVTRQRAIYRERREAFLEALDGSGVTHDGGPGTFYLWLADAAGRDAWTVADEFARAGIVVAPGDLFGEDRARHVRVALVAPSEILAPALSRLPSVLRAG